MDQQEPINPASATQESSGQERGGKKKRSKPQNARTQAEQVAYEPEHARPAARRSSDDRANAFNTLAWLVEGATGLVEELRHSDLGLSEEFWVHVYAMRREGLLAARSAIDSLLAQSDKASREAHEQSMRQARRGGVAVE
jgi:hypothetical protein